MDISEQDKRTDEQIVAESLHNRQAYAGLVLRYGEKLKRYIWRLTNLGPEDINDIMQNVFIKAYVNLNGFNPSLKFSSWIYRIAHNEAVSFLRQKSVRPKVVCPEGDLDCFELLMADIDMEKEAQTFFDAKKIGEIMEGMDPEFRTILILKYFEQKDYSEISDILQKPMGSVASQLSRAKEKFRALAKKKDIKF
jgi:RNA polymerase sigma-70 factor (ECF subfamily)